MDTPKPGDFPIGGVESRDAMRLHLSNRRDESARTVFISRIPRPWHDDGQEPEDWNKVPQFSAPQTWGDRTMRVLYVPVGISEKEARKRWKVAPRTRSMAPRGNTRNSERNRARSVVVQANKLRG